MYILPEPALADELLQFYEDRIHWRESSPSRTEILIQMLNVAPFSTC